MKWPAALAALVLVAACGAQPPPRARAPKLAESECLALVSTLRRARSVRDAERAAAALRGHVDRAALDLTAPAVAATARIRRAAALAIEDHRATTARRLFTQARMIELRAQGLLAELAETCQ